jgi:hypothetical protein
LKGSFAVSQPVSSLGLRLCVHSRAQEMGVPPLPALTGNVLFGAGAVLMLGAAVRR